MVVAAQITTALITEPQQMEVVLVGLLEQRELMVLVAVVALEGLAQEFLVALALQFFVIQTRILRLVQLPALQQ